MKNTAINQNSININLTFTWAPVQSVELHFKVYQHEGITLKMKFVRINDLHVSTVKKKWQRIELDLINYEIVRLLEHKETVSIYF